MSIETALVAIKTADTTLNELVGTRFHPDGLPQHVAFPCVKFKVIARVPVDRTFNSRVQITEARVQVDGYAASAAGRSALRVAIWDCYELFRGPIGGEVIENIWISLERQGLEMQDTETAAYHIGIDLMVDIRQ